MDNSLAAPQNVKNRVPERPSNPSSGYLAETLKTIYLQRHANLYVNCSITPTMAKTRSQPECPSAEDWKKKDVVCVRRGAPLSRQKQRSVALHDNMNGPWEYHSK